MHPGEAEFPRHLLTVTVEEFVVVDGTESHVVGEARRVGDAHREAPFAVESNHHRNFGHFLSIVADSGVLSQCSFGEKEASASVGFEIASHGGLGGVTLRGHDFNEHQLCYSLAVGEGGVDRIGPAVGFNSLVPFDIRSCGASCECRCN